MADETIKHDYNGINLNEAQKDQIQKWNEYQAGNIASAAAPGTLDSTDKFVYFAAFDGTSNDRNNMPETTNVFQLWTEVESKRPVRLSITHTFYAEFIAKLDFSQTR